jgi:hypothetical protein
MAYLQHLISLVLLSLAALPAMATIPTIMQFSPSNITPAVWYDDATAACTASMAAKNVSPPAGYHYEAGSPLVQTTSGGVPNGCGIKYMNGTTFYGNADTGLVNRSGYCPANSTLSGGSCTCTSPYTQDATNTKCVPPPDPCAPLKGLSAGDWWRDTGVNAAGTGPKSRSFSVCDGYNTMGGGKCVATVSNAECTNSDTDGMSGFWRCGGKAVYTGTSGVAGKCDPVSAGKGSGDTPADPSPATPPVPGSDPPKPPAPKPADGLPSPAPCGAGQAPGTVNGTTSCYPTGSDVPKAGGRDSSTNNADGSKETVHDETNCVAGGSKCTTDTTKCTTAAGATTATCSTTTTTDTATGTCAKNPGNSVCGGGNGAPGSSFGGSCAAGYKAVGEDPVLNAMAQEQYTRNCQVFATDKPESVVVANASDATGLQKATTPGDSTVSIGSGNFDTSNALGGGGGCSLNKTITVAHMTATLPFDVLCDPLAYLGQLLVAVSLLLAARIVARG